MNLEIKEKKENSLLERAEVAAVVSFDGATPPTAQMRDLVVQKLGCNPDLMVIRKVKPGFGEQSVSLRIHIYKSPSQLRKIEEDFVLKRNKLDIVEEKKEGEKGEPKAEEKPAENEKKE
jgi:small subunit ribosomal protein S24e